MLEHMIKSWVIKLISERPELKVWIKKAFDIESEFIFLDLFKSFAADNKGAIADAMKKGIILGLEQIEFSEEQRDQCGKGED